MAIDTWLLEQHRLGLHPPTLRFYYWSPVAISLGYHQSSYPERWQQLVWDDKPVDLVRRPSGGRAVLHQGDLTYSVIASGFAGTRMQVYQAICEFLIRGWQTLGVELTYGEAGRGYIHNPNCFGTATGADLVTPAGVKLVGSAQLRRGAAFLQHGSIRLTTEPELFRQVFGVELPPLQLPVDLAWFELVEVLTTAAQHTWDIELTPQSLSAAEWQQIAAYEAISIA